MDKDITDIYNKIYCLPELFYEEKVGPEFFNSCRENYNFVVLVIYNENKEFLLIRDLNKTIGWELVGGHIDLSERVEDAVNRIASAEAGLSIDELQPFAIIKNTFSCCGQQIIHKGIAFIVLSRDKANFTHNNIRTIYTEIVPDRMAYQDRTILTNAITLLKNKEIAPPYNEIDTTRCVFPAIIHKIFKKIGQSASIKIRDTIKNIISDNPLTIADVVCGDDEFIFELEKNYSPNLCVANDIAWKSICRIKDKYKKSRIIFTNHNVMYLPYCQNFDLVLFKNALHHVPQYEQGNLIKKLSTLSKQLVVIDIENPNNSGLLAKIWHWYYVYILKDQGKTFLSFAQFKRLIQKNTKNKTVNFGSIKTVKGKYFYASAVELDSSKENEEVEIKVVLNPEIVHVVKRNLMQVGACSLGSGEETDIYFTAPHKDFIESRECLRIREKDSSIEITYKGPTDNLMRRTGQFWKQEVNLDISSSAREAEDLLTAIGFNVVARVVKIRDNFRWQEALISIDKVKGVGWFLEVESFVDKDGRQSAIERNQKILNDIGLSGATVVDKPYRDIVIESLRQA